MKVLEIFCILCIYSGFVEGAKFKKRSQTYRSRKHSINLRAKSFQLQEDEYLHLPKSCAEGSSGIISIRIPYMDMGPFTVVCKNYVNGNWLVVLNRFDGSVDFHRPWSEYKKGFGTLNGEFFIGLEKLYLLTLYSLQQLLFLVTDFDNEEEFGMYNEFIIGSETQAYRLLKLGNYSGNMGDTFSYHFNQSFTTFDRNNGENDIYNCATMYHGGWWYDRCECSGLFLTGEYGATKNYFHKRLHALKIMQMLIRPEPSAN